MMMPELPELKPDDVKPVPGPTVTIGCDPELFAVDKRGRVVGSERILPAVGGSRLVVKDGVQFELHPDSTTCRANVGNSLKEAICQMNEFLKKKGNGEYRISFKQLVTVTKGELLGLSEEARRLGCLPSKNVYGHKTPEIDGMVYRKRTGAGHIHLGFITTGIKMDRAVRLLDIVVGNTCVLLDRDTAAAVERRKNYGKAGEYRTPTHGLEYRTPSNFWLRSYQLFSLLAGLSRQTIRIASCTEAMKKKAPYNGYHLDLGDELLAGVTDDQIQHAINMNDYDAALDIYTRVVRPVLWKLQAGEGVDHNNLKDFDFFLTKPIEKWFPTDPLIHWQNVPEGHGCGWENFLEKTVRPYRLGAEATVAAPKIKILEAQP